MALLPSYSNGLKNTSPRTKSRTLIFLYISFLLSVMSLYLLPTLFPRHIGSAYIFIYCVMSCISIFIWWSQEISPWRILILASLTICLLIPMQMLTSNDAERYLWDGAVFLARFDPYITAPNAETVTELRKIWPTPEEHAAYPTLYPPGALLLFSLCALGGVSYGFWIWKTLCALAAILSLFFAYDLLKKRNALQHFSLMALSPLLLLETGVGAHLDIFCVLGIIATLWCLQKEKIIAAAIIIGLAATIKFFPAVIAGPFLFYLKPKKAVTLFLAASLTWISVYMMMFICGYKPLGLLPTFFEKWRGGAPFYPLLEVLKNSFQLSQKQFFIILGSLSLLGFGLSAYLARKRHIYIAIMIAIATPLLISPVLFPWYLMAFLPLLVLRPNVTGVIAITLAPLSYIVLNKWLSEGIWQPSQWPAIILAFGIIYGLFIDLKIIPKR